MWFIATTFLLHVWLQNNFFEIVWSCVIFLICEINLTQSCIILATSQLLRLILSLAQLYLTSTYISFFQFGLTIRRSLTIRRTLMRSLTIRRKLIRSLTIRRKLIRSLTIRRKLIRSLTIRRKLIRSLFLGKQYLIKKRETIVDKSIFNHPDLGQVL